MITQRSNTKDTRIQLSFIMKDVTEIFAKKLKQHGSSQQHLFCFGKVIFQNTTVIYINM